MERLRRAGKALLEWRDHPAPWRRTRSTARARSGAWWMSSPRSRRCRRGPAWDRDVLYLDTTRARTGAAAIADGLVPAEDLDGLEALLVDLHHDRGSRKPRKGSGAGYSKRQTRAAVWDARQQLYDCAGRLRARANADLAAALQGDLQDSLDRYDALKAAEGALDFVDLLLRARELLRDDAEVRRTFRQRLSHVFVDEFQDTDPLQAEIVVLLSGDPDADAVGPVDWQEVQPRPGSLFIVGDPKQSIYRFRRADIGTYRAVCEWLESRGAARATLTTSFRATPVIQRVVNAAFAPLMTDDADDATAAVRQADAVAGRSSDAALGRGLAGAAPIRRAQRHQRGYREVAAGCGGGLLEVAVRRESLEGVGAQRDDGEKRAGAGAPPSRVSPVPPIHQLRPGRHAALRAGPGSS